MPGPCKSLSVADHPTRPKAARKSVRHDITGFRKYMWRGSGIPQHFAMARSGFTGLERSKAEIEGAAYLGDKPSPHKRHRNRSVVSRVSGPSGVIATDPKMPCGYNYVLRGRCLLTGRVYTDCIARETQYPFANDPLRVQRGNKGHNIPS